MTAHRPRETDPGERPSLIEVLFSAEPAPRLNWWVSRQTRLWRPPTDVYETEAEILVLVEVAGVRAEDFRIVLQDRLLVISGLRTDPRPERRAYYQMEVHFGEFRTDLELPVPVDVSRIEAEYSQGFLRVVLPKARAERVRIE